MFKLFFSFFLFSQLIFFLHLIILAANDLSFFNFFFRLNLLFKFFILFLQIFNNNVFHFNALNATKSLRFLLLEPLFQLVYLFFEILNLIFLYL